MTARNLQCSCCGEDAGRFRQYHNQDTGYGICRSCVDRFYTKGPDAEMLEFRFGEPHINFEGKTTPKDVQ